MNWATAGQLVYAKYQDGWYLANIIREPAALELSTSGTSTVIQYS